MEDYILIFIALGAAGVFNLFVCGMTIIAADRVDRLADEIKETVSGANFNIQNMVQDMIENSNVDIDVEGKPLRNARLKVIGYVEDPIERAKAKALKNKKEVDE